jgi:siroheme synthase-like protein
MFFPLFLRLEGRRVVVVGGGEIAVRKARELVTAGAEVTVIAPELHESVPPEATWVARAYERGDLHGAWLAIAATDDRTVQGRVAEEAAAQRTFVIAADDLEHTSALSPAVVRRGPVTIAISSGGEAPALTRLLREIVEQLLPEERYVQVARDLRRRWKAEGLPMRSRFAELVQALKA